MLRILLTLPLCLLHVGLVSALAMFSSGAESNACQCTFGAVTVPVDIRIPVNPAEGLNTTKLRRLNQVFNIFGQFCAPAGSPIDTDRVQLLLHGSTYTHQYWTFPMNGFQNYSYAAHACSQGQTTFSYDQLGVGLSDRPLNSTDVQLPVAAQIASFLAKQLKEGEISSLFGFGRQRFKKVVTISHSQGSIIFNFVAITQPTGSGIDAMILTGHIHDVGFPETVNSSRPPARDVDPARWGNLDSGYITVPDRSQFYAPDKSTFSSDVFMLDTLTKDVSSIWITSEVLSVYTPAIGFRGSVVEMIGEMDQVHCLNSGDNNTPCNETALQTSEARFWPDSRNFTVMVRQGSGHDLNLDFGAAETFRLYSSLVQSLV